VKLLGRCWRTAATLLCFAVFMAGSALFLPVAVPLLGLAPSAEARRRRGKGLARAFFRCFTGLMQGLGVLELGIEGGEVLGQKGLFLVANHPSLIDFVVLAGRVPQADCLVKSSLLDHWAMRWPVRLSGYIPNDRGEETLELCRRSLDEGNSIVVFAEGTRSVPGSLPALKRGAAQLALRCGRPITPVAIRCPDSNLHKGGPWYVAPRERFRMRLTVLEPLDTAAALARNGGEASPAARELTALIEQRIHEVLERD
jgi:1-acyl-sn-glycerol-3-phosphate acyltransferase